MSKHLSKKSKDRAGFVLYKSWYPAISSLSDDQIGRLTRAIFEYHIFGYSPSDSSDIFMAFQFIKGQFDVDQKKYESTCQRNLDNVKKRWENDTKNTTGKNGIPNIPLDTKNTDEDVDVDRNKKRKIDEDIHRSFAHLSISKEDFKKLTDLGYSAPQVESVIDSIQNYSKNKNYKDLFLTAKAWLKKEPVEAPKKGGVVL